MSRLILACALAGILAVPAFGQQAVNAEEGVYVLNPTKSTFRGPGARNQNINVEKETITVIGFGPDGKPFIFSFPNADSTADGQPHPAKGLGFDATTSTRLNPYTTKAVRTKDGKVLQTLIAIYNPDGKTLTVTVIGTNSFGQINHVLVFEKQ